MFRNDIPSNAAELPADGRIFKNARMNSSACQIRIRPKTRTLVKTRDPD
jgi:hypothetical protein